MLFRSTIDMTHTLLGPTGGTLFLGAAADSWLTDEQAELWRSIVDGDDA